MNKWRILGLLMVTLMAVACAGKSSPGGQEPTGAPVTGGEAQVVMRNITFQPSEITVAPGTKVTWTNEDSVPHTVVSGTRGSPTDMFDSGNVGPGATFSFTFEQPGTYDYFCSIHPGMKGTVLVQ